MTLDQIIRHNGLPFEVTNDDQITIQLRKLQAELVKGTEAVHLGKTKGIDEVRAMFSDSDNRLLFYTS